MIDRSALDSEFNIRRGPRSDFDRLLNRLGFALRLRLYTQATGRFSELHDKIVESTRAEYQAAKAAVEETQAAVNVGAMFEHVMNGGYDADIMDLLEDPIAPAGQRR